jgi:hypothetical protein
VGLGLNGLSVVVVLNQARVAVRLLASFFIASSASLACALFSKLGAQCQPTFQMKVVTSSPLVCGDGLTNLSKKAACECVKE